MQKETISTQERLAARQYGKNKDFWLKKLAGFPDKSTFYYDFPSRGNGERRLETLEFQWDRKLFSLLEKVSDQSLFRLHIILAAGLAALVQKYNGNADIVLGTPVYKQEMDIKFVNTVLVLRIYFHDRITFKELLMQMRETISAATDHVNYPVKMLGEDLGLPMSKTGDFPLFDISILLDNIHDKKYLHHIDHNVALSFIKKDYVLQGTVEYNALLFHADTIERMVRHYRDLLRQALGNVDAPIQRIQMISQNEREQLLVQFNNTQSDYPQNKTIIEWFARQAQQRPHSIAAISPIDWEEIHRQLISPTSNHHLFEKIKTCLFKKNPYLYEWDLQISPPLHALKTNHHNSVIVNTTLAKLLELFDGKRKPGEIYNRITNRPIKLLLQQVESGDLLEISLTPGKVERFTCETVESFYLLLKTLYRCHLIVPVGVNSGWDFNHDFQEETGDFDEDETSDLEVAAAALGSYLRKQGNLSLSKARVLLLGDTPGMPTTGLLYLASYLKRNGISACCRFYDFTTDFVQMKTNLEMLLENLQPEVVAISMKWFLYMARVLDMCRIVKDYSRKNRREIKVVLGGNTASYYWQRLIQYDCVDYVIRGDGEEPLLALSRNKKPGDIPNCVFKSRGKVVENSFTYVQDEIHSRQIYLSHLDEILLDKHTIAFAAFFIYTHKGCAMNCLYCGGCNRAQKIAFNRNKVMRRGVKEVRKDIMEARTYASTFQFDFDIPTAGDKDLLDYCRAIWKDIDLSAHFCILSTLKPPSTDFIRLVAGAFNYIYWDFDVCTLSQRHRKQLGALGLVKPLPTDEEILAFLDRCELHDNINVRLNLVTGLPYFTPEDITTEEALLSRIMKAYSCFGGLHWARLHAQPGAPVVDNAQTYHMHSYATEFDDFLTYSEKNFDRQTGYSYTGVEHLNYPYIYFHDDQLNSTISHFYYETGKRLEQYLEIKKPKSLPPQYLTYRQLNQRAGILAVGLRENGVQPGSIAAVMLNPSLDIPVALLGVLKTGSAFLPIDPQYPEERVNYLLADSKAKILLNSQRLSHHLATCTNSILTSTSTCQVSPTNPAYVIYTSGTSGKSKGVILTHKNLVNYVHWFSQTSRLTEKDRTILTSSFAFDLGYTSIFPCLLQGGQLYLLPKEVYLQAEELLTIIKQQRITYLKVTPSLLTVIVNSPFFSAAWCDSLRLVVVGGEPIILQDVKKLHNTCPHVEIINHYGPTEATIGSIATFVDFNKFEEYKTHPVIGKPIYNTRVYILGRDLGLVPLGVPGELCISGTCLARGYLNQPELTADKFCPRPPLQKLLIEKVPGKNHELMGIDKNHMQLCSHAAMQLYPNHSPYYHIPPLSHHSIYLTGDLARWLPNGTVEFLGRIDHQIKIRGYRVELGEIENRLVEHPQIKEAVVVEKKDEDGSHYLCAYYVPEMGVVSTLSGEEKIRYQRQMLLLGWGEESQQKLKNTTVFVAGAGGGASPTIMQLALAGFGTIRVCDHDSIELSNLNRQFLHDTSRIGMNKALSAKMTIQRVNPNVTVFPIKEKLTSQNASLLVGDAAVIFDMFDDLGSKFVLSRCAFEKDIPHVIAAMTDISSYTAIFHPPATPCFHCIFDKNKLETLVSGMKRVIQEYEKNPLPVAAPSLFVSTGFVVNEVIKILLGIRKPAYNKFFFFNQGGTESIGESLSFRAMTYAFSEHFRKICKEQGFDWDEGWDGNYLEEFHITTNPQCPLCGNKYKKKFSLKPSTPYPLSRLREYLLQILPEYMVPRYFVPLQEIILTPNGKVNRAALPEPLAHEVDDGYTPPDNEVEKKLVEIWSEVLDIPQNKIGIDDNFFRLGGHSLKVTLLVSRVHQDMNKSLSLADIFNTPTIRELAKNLSGSSTDIFSSPLTKDENLVLLRRGTPGAHDPRHLFLIHAGSGEVDGYVEFCHHLNPGFNYWGIKTTRLDSYTPINITIEEVARKYIQKIRTVQPHGPYFIFGWCIGGTIAFEIVKQMEQQAQEIGLLALVNTSPPPQDIAGTGSPFTLSSELELVRELLPGKNSELEEKLSPLSHLNQLWPLMIDHLANTNTNPASIRKLFPQNIADATPNFEQAGIKELIYYLNVIRTYDNARNAYIPAVKNKTITHFFGANKTEIIDRHAWNQYCTHPYKFYEISGDHFSILRIPDVIPFSKIFDDVISKCLL